MTSVSRHFKPEEPGGMFVPWYPVFTGNRAIKSTIYHQDILCGIKRIYGLWPSQHKHQHSSMHKSGMYVLCMPLHMHMQVFELKEHLCHYVLCIHIYIHKHTWYACVSSLNLHQHQSFLMMLVIITFHSLLSLFCHTNVYLWAVYSVFIRENIFQADSWLEVWCCV